MPRRSPFDVTLTPDERQTLESLARKYTSPYCDVIRARIILLAAEGLSSDVIAARLDTPRQIVSKWRKRFCLARVPGLEDEPRGGRKARFSPSLVVKVKALACELPHRLGVPLSRLSIAEIRQHMITQGLVAEISGATLWRWLSSDALRPWQHRSWIFRAIHILRPRPVCFSISMSAFGSALPWARRTSLSPRMKRPAFKLDAGNNRPGLRLPIAPCESSTSTFVRAPGLTWQLGTSIEPKSSAVVNTRLALLR